MKFHSFVLIYFIIALYTIIFNHHTSFIHSFSPTGELTPAEQRERRKLLQKFQQQQWEKEYSLNTLRERIWICKNEDQQSNIVHNKEEYIDKLDNEHNRLLSSSSLSSNTNTLSHKENYDRTNINVATNGEISNCYWKGLQILLVENSGLIACRDCPDVQNEGLYSKLYGYYGYFIVCKYDTKISLIISYIHQWIYI